MSRTYFLGSWSLSLGIAALMATLFLPFLGGAGVDQGHVPDLAPELAIGWVQAPVFVMRGESFPVEWLAKNQGDLDAYDIPYRLTARGSQVDSSFSVTIGEGVIASLRSQEEMRLGTFVSLPDDLAEWYIIAIELGSEGSIVAFSGPVSIMGWQPPVVELGLPNAQVDVFYCVRLMAFFGDAQETWSVKPGSSLPPGLGLVIRKMEDGRSATFLQGTPSEAGDFSFTLEVRSDKGELKERKFELRVSLDGDGLRVATTSLEDAAFGLEYEDWLSGLGGHPPYDWKIVGGTLPKGISLHVDGQLNGVPEQDGQFLVTFRLRDSRGREATRELELTVTPPAALTCVTKELPVLELGVPFRPVPLLAAGGVKTETGGYIWKKISAILEPASVDEVPEEIPEGVPPGLRLEQGSVMGTPRVAGTYTWTVRVTDVMGATQDCPIRVDVERDYGITVATRSLPVAVVGKRYDAQIIAIGGDGLYLFSELEPGTLLAKLGLDLGQDGSLTGTPSRDLLEGEGEREFNFTVQVKDGKNRIGTGALTIRLREKGLETTGGSRGELDGGIGCQAVSGETGFWLVALLGLAALGRRRRSQ